MSSYPPNNLCVYIYAQAGCMGALIAARNQPTDPNEADYADAAERADFFAQEIDTIWGVGSYTNADLQQIQSAAASLWAGGRSPVPGAAGLTAAGYTGIAQAIIAGVKAGTAQIVAEGINPNGCGGGGTGGGTLATRTSLSGIIGASNQITFDAPAYTPLTTGSALLIVNAEVTTSGSGDGVALLPRVANANLAGLGGNASAVAGTIGSGSFSCVIPITQGVALTPGVQAANNTGAHTCSCAAGGLQVTIIELQGSGSGGGTVTSVTGSAPIVITGSAASPNVTITAATDGAAGSMSAADKTKLDGITVGNVGAIYDQNTTSNQGSGGPTIVALIQLTVKGSGRFRFSAKANATVVSGDTSQWTLTTQSGTGAVTTTGGASTGSSNGIVPATGVALVSNSGVPGTGIVITGGNGLDTQTIATEGGGTTIGAGATLLDKFNASGVLQNGGYGPFAPSGSNVFLILSYTNSAGNRQIGNIVLSLEEE